MFIRDHGGCRYSAHKSWAGTRDRSRGNANEQRDDDLYTVDHDDGDTGNDDGAESTGIDDRRHRTAENTHATRTDYRHHGSGQNTHATRTDYRHHGSGQNARATHTDYGHHQNDDFDDDTVSDDDGVAQHDDNRPGIRPPHKSSP